MHDQSVPSPSDTPKDRFPLLRKILRALGLSGEAIDDIVERILDWLSTKEPAGGIETYPYRLRDDFLSPAELSFFRVLDSVTAGRAVVCAKVSLADLFFAETGDHRKNRAFANRIDRKHVDFLLCEPKTMRPVLGLELDDRSHQRPDRQARDRLVEGAFAAAGLPLVRVVVKSAYVPGEILAVLEPHLKSTTSPEPPPAGPGNQTSGTAQATVPQTSNAPPKCPKCGAPMVLRTAKTGTNAGGQFWGCSNFPRCRSVLAVS